MLTIDIWPFFLQIPVELINTAIFLYLTAVVRLQGHSDQVMEVSASVCQMLTRPYVALFFS